VSFSLALAVSLPAASARAEAAAPLSLTEAVEVALLHSPQALAARYNAEASQARTGQARSGWLPQLNSTTLARGDYSYQTGTATGKETVSSFRYSSSLQLNQLIYDFGRTSGRIGAAEAGARASREDAEATRAQLALAAMTSFFTVLQNEALREVAYVNLEQQNRRLQQAESFFKIGTRPQIDVLIARTAVANAQLQVVQMQGNVQIARTQLLSALGLPEGEWGAWLNRPLVPMLPAPLPLETAATASTIPGQPAPLPDAVIDEALAQRPDFQAMRARLVQAEQQVRVAYGDYFPTLAVGASAGVSGSVSGLAVNTVGVIRTDVPTSGEPGFSLSGSLTLNWSLLSGLSTVYAVREARALRDAARANLDALRLQVRSQLQQTALQVITARQSVDSAAAVVLQAENQLEMATGRYKAGVGNAIELGDAQLAASTARAQKVQADYGLAQARANLMWQLGRIVARAQSPAPAPERTQSSAAPSAAARQGGSP
jgi:outer membrane protein